MGLKCVMSSCQPTPATTIFNFPIAKAKRQKWLAALNLDINYQFEGPTGVCELHFQPSYYKKVGLIVLLAVNAVPDLCSRNFIEPQTNITDGLTFSSPTATPTVIYDNKTKIIAYQQIQNQQPSTSDAVLINNNKLPLVTSSQTAVPTVTYDNSPKIIPLQQIKNQPPSNIDAVIDGLTFSSSTATPTVIYDNKTKIIPYQQIQNQQPSTNDAVLINNNKLPLVTSSQTAVPTVTYDNSPKIIPLQQIKNQPPSNIDAVLIKMEVDDENPQPNSNNPINLQTPIALPMIEPDSIKIEVENTESDVPDPLDPFLDRIHNIERRKENAVVQAKMKECKAKLRDVKKKINNLKRNLKINTVKFDKVVATDKQYTKDLKKFSKLRMIYLKSELKIPKLIYDRFAMVEFDGLKYPNDLKQFAIELYSKSPIAYDYVRESLCNVIPHTDAILRWTKPPDNLENEE